MRDPAELARLAAEVRAELHRLDHDPSPHAPEVPYFLRQAIDDLLRALEPEA